MKKLINKALSMFTAFVMIFLSAAQSFTAAFAAEIDTTDLPLLEQTLAAEIYTDEDYKEAIADGSTEITLTGAMPRGAIVKAYPVEYDLADNDNDKFTDSISDDDTDKYADNKQIVAAYDITIFEADGETVFQPQNDSINVTFKLPELEEADENVLSVIHVGEDGAEDEITDVMADNGEISIEAESFSVYIIVKHTKGDIVTPQVVFHYLSYAEPNENDNTLYTADPYIIETAAHTSAADPTQTETEKVWTQIVKDGETLDMVPTPPDIKDSHFNGWYIVELVGECAGGEHDKATYRWPNDPIRQVFDQPVHIGTAGDDQSSGSERTVPANSEITWSIGDISQTAAADDNGAVHVYLAPLYVNYRFVNFYDFNGVLIGRKLLVLDSNNMATMLVSDLTATNFDSNYHFMGWSNLPITIDENGAVNADAQTLDNTFYIYKNGVKVPTYITLYQDGSCIKIYEGRYTSQPQTDPKVTIESSGQQNVNLYAEYDKAHWISYKAGETGSGALYVPAESLIGKQAADALPTTSRSGYSFDGWFTADVDSDGKVTQYREQVTDGQGNVVGEIQTLHDSAGNEAAHIGADGLTLSSDITLYAKWTASDIASYKVIIWKQKVDDDKYAAPENRKYDYYKSYTFNYQSGQDIVTENAHENYLDLAGSGDFKHFTLGRYTQKINVNPQGTSVINIYYDREIMNIEFYLNGAGTTYTETTSNTGTQYALDDEEAIELVRKGEEVPIWKTSETYTSTTSDSQGNAYYGLINGEYVPLRQDVTTVTTYTWTFVRNHSTNTMSSSNTDGKFYTRSGSSWSLNYTASEYTIDSPPPATDNTVYFCKYKGSWSWSDEYYELTRDSKTTTNYTYYRMDDNTEYPGTRYTKSETGSKYTGTRYIKDSSGNYTIAPDNTEEQQYGIDGNGGYVRISNDSTETVYKWYIPGKQVQYIQDENGNYGKNENGEYIVLDPPVTYKTANGEKYTELSSTPGNSGNIYGLINNTLVSLTYRNNGSYWYWGNSTNNKYTGTFYQKASESSKDYTGQIYTISDNSFAETTDIAGNNLYGREGDTYYKLNVTVVRDDLSYLTPDGDVYTGTRYSYDYPLVEYTGTRYTKSTINSGWRLYKRFFGLYGSSFDSEQNGYIWSTDYWWYDSYSGNTPNGTRTTFLADFTSDDNSLKFYGTGASSTSKKVEFYKQNLNGDYVLANTVGVSGGTFSIKDKYTGFYADHYQADNNAPVTLNGLVSGHDYYATGVSYTNTLRIYFARNSSYELTFITNYPGGASFKAGDTPTNDRSIPQLNFEQPLAPFFDKNSGSHISDPVCPQHYEFEGWYEDASCTVKFDAESKMPAANKAVYGKWHPIYYTVSVNPNGGVLAGNADPNQATYFWKQYGSVVNSYANVSRPYIEVDSSDISSSDPTKDKDGRDLFYYRYVYFLGDEHYRDLDTGGIALWSIPESDQENRSLWRDNEGFSPAQRREAEYIKVGDHQRYGVDEFYTYLVDGLKRGGLTQSQAEAQAKIWDDKYTDTTKKYRISQSGDPKWSIVGWYQIDDNGKKTPYDFNSPVVDNLKLIAEWRLTGAYTYIFKYSADMTETIDGISVHGTLTGETYDTTDPLEIENDPTKGYADKADTIVQTAPKAANSNYDSHVFEFQGWRIVNNEGKPLDDNGNVLPEGSIGTLYQPGETIQIRSEQSYIDSLHNAKIINVEAYYKDIIVSDRHPKTVDKVTLYPQTNEGGYIDDSISTPWPKWSENNAGAGIVVGNDRTDKKIEFTNIQNNIGIHLEDYVPFFKNETGYFHVGYVDDTQGSEAHGYIPEYPANAVLGADRIGEDNNDLYAVWEPMVYVTFNNNTGSAVTLNFEGSDDENAMSIINNATQRYERERITDYTRVVVAAGKTMKIVIPKGEVHTFKVSFTNNHSGFRMTASVKYPVITGGEITVETKDLHKENPDTASGEKPPIEYLGKSDDTRTLVNDAAGIIYDFNELPLPDAVFDVNGGTWSDKFSIYGGNNNREKYNTSHANYDSASNFQYVSTETTRDLFQIETTKFTKPSDPTPPTNLTFIGWTLDPAVAKIHDFSVYTDDISSIPGLSDTERDTLIGRINEYKLINNITTGINLMEVVENYLLYNFDSTPGGFTLYAVYTETVTVNYHMMAYNAGSAYNHQWGGAQMTTEPVLSSVNENSKAGVNRSYDVYSRKVWKGRRILKPHSPTYNAALQGNDAANHYNFLYWVKYDSSLSYQQIRNFTCQNTDPTDVTPFDFSQPITEDIDFYTSWTTRPYAAVTITKNVEGTYAETNAAYELYVTVTTDQYEVYNNVIRSVTNDDTVTTNYTIESGSPLDIPLYYWCDNKYLYIRNIEIEERNHDTNGYSLTITPAEGSSAKIENNKLIYKPFGDLNTNFRFKNGGMPNNQNRGWIYTSPSNNSEKYFYSSTWYTGNDINTPTAAPTEINTSAIFTNKRDLRFRFVKFDSDEVHRINGGTFEIGKLSGGTVDESSVISMTSGSVKLGRESAPQSGRLITSGRRNVTNADESLSFDAERAEIVFLKTGQYRLTETAAPPGYTFTAGRNYIDITVNSDGTFEVKDYRNVSRALNTDEQGFLWKVQSISQLNNLEPAKPNEYGVALLNEPIITKVRFLLTDVVNNNITGGSEVKFVLDGSSTQRDQPVTYELVVNRDTALTDFAELPYGRYELEQKTVSDTGYKPAELSVIIIEPDGTVTASGSNVGSITQPDQDDTHKYRIQIKNERVGYNLKIQKKIGPSGAVYDPDTEYRVELKCKTPDSVKNKTFAVITYDGGDTQNGASSVFTFNDSGVCEFTIKPDQIIEVRSLPKELDYSVKELDVEAGSVSYSRYHESGLETNQLSVDDNEFFALTNNTVVKITNTLTKTPAPTAVDHVSRFVFAVLLTLCIAGVGIYYVRLHRKEVGYYDI